MGLSAGLSATGLLRRWVPSPPVVMPLGRFRPGSAASRMFCGFHEVDDIAVATVTPIYSFDSAGFLGDIIVLLEIQSFF